MVASVQKNTTEFLTEYLHFSCPFDNFLRCLACATYIAAGKKVLSTTDVHGQYRNQIPTTLKFLPAWYWDSHQPSMPNCHWDYSCCDGCQGNVFIEYREKLGNTKEGLTTTMHIPIPGCIFSLCWCSTGSGTAGEWSLLQFFRESEKGKRNPSPTSYSAPASHSFFCISLHCLCIKN